VRIVLDTNRIVVTGDKALLRTSGYRGIEVLTPRMLLNRL
jgi:predicted nucleic acid-binding protein